MHLSISQRHNIIFSKRMKATRIVKKTKKQNQSPPHFGAHCNQRHFDQRGYTAAFRSKQLLAVSSGLKALAKNTLHISHLSKSKHPLHPHANGSWRHHTGLIGCYIHSHYADSARNSIHSQSTKNLKCY